MKVRAQKAGVLFMFAGLSKRLDYAPIAQSAVERWVNEEATLGTIDRDTLWLFRTGFLNSVDGVNFAVSESGWQAIGECMENELSDEACPDARSEDADVLILLGEWQLKSEAQLIAANLLGYPADIKRGRR